MFRQIFYNLGAYTSYLERLRFSYTRFEKQGVRPFSEYADYALLDVKKYLLGSMIYFTSVMHHPDLFDKDETGHAADAKRDSLLLSCLVKHGLYLFPAHAFYPSIAKITLTTRCNYNCGHCFQKGYRTGDDVSRQEVQQFLALLNDANVHELSLIGGELFLEPELIFDTIQLAKERGIKVCTITTNGFWCSDEQKVEEYLRRLRELRYTGNINISMGLGHEKKQDITWFKGLRALSERALGRNIFFFTVEELSYERFLKKKAELERTLKGYSFRLVRIVQIGGGKSLREDILDSNRTREQAGRCCGIGLHLLPGGKVSFCLGPACLLPEYHICTLSPGMRLEDLLGKNTLLATLLSRHMGEELHDAVRNRIHGEFPTFCDLCVHLSKDDVMMDRLHTELEKGR